MDLPSIPRIPIGDWVSNVVDYLVGNYRPIFRGFSSIINSLIDGFEAMLEFIPALVLILFFMVLVAFLRRKISLVIFVGVGLFLIYNIGLWSELVITMASILTAVFVSTIVGVPLGILKAHSRVVDVITRPILDIMQTIPVFVYLIPALMFFGLGIVSGVIATIVFAIPPPIRLTYLGIKQVPNELKEAGKAFGSNYWQMLWKVEIPSAFPSIMLGINQCIMLSLSMVVIASMIGAGGLGRPVMRSMATVNISMGFEAGMAVVLLAMVLDRLFSRD